MGLLDHFGDFGLRQRQVSSCIILDQEVWIEHSGTLLHIQFGRLSAAVGGMCVLLKVNKEHKTKPIVGKLRYHIFWGLERLLMLDVWRQNHKCKAHVRVVNKAGALFEKIFYQKRWRRLFGIHTIMKSQLLKNGTNISIFWFILFSVL